jgi:hypothetical protein
LEDGIAKTTGNERGGGDVEKLKTDLSTTEGELKKAK